MVCSIKKLGRGKVAGRLVVRASFHYSTSDQAGWCRLVLVLWVWLGGTFRCLFGRFRCWCIGAAWHTVGS